MIVNVPVNIPDWLIEPLVQIVILYRRLRYGCAFRKIPLTQGKFAIVDPDDYHRLKKYNWTSSKGYAQRNLRTATRRTSVMMHRQILNVVDNLVVDHINHNGFDNRKANLRPATQLQNTWNSLHKRGKNRFRGVFWNKEKNKWQLQLTHKYKKITLGYFDDEVEAAKVYDEEVKKLRGEFAVLNFDNGKVGTGSGHG